MGAGTRARSPYEIALGDRVGELHPRLRTYFSAIPSGSVGHGTGVFDTVGTPRRWLWPLFGVFRAWDVLFPVWEQGVAFTIENRRAASGAVEARRSFHLPGGDRIMVDSVSMTGVGLVDALGRGGPLRAAFDASVVDGALVLESTRVGVRIAGARIRIPRPIAPCVRLVERFDDSTDRQHVAVVIDLPVVGRIYEYSGTFEYTIEGES